MKMIKQIFQPKEVLLKEMLLNNEKLNWEKRFFKSYKYSTNQDKKHQIKRFQICKYYYIVVDNVDVGYLRIIELNKMITITDSDITSLGEIYIKPNYRNNGYARLAIIKLIKEHKLNMICMEREVYIENEYYYQSLGFDCVVHLDLGSHRNTYITTEYGLSVLEDIHEKLNDMNNEKLAA